MPALPPQARVERNAEVVRDRARGLGWSKVAERNGLSERQCRRICEEWRATRPSAYDHDPLALLDEILDHYDAGIEDLALVREEALQDAVKVGAVKARMNLIREKAELLQAVGILPRDLGKFAEERDLRVVADTVWAVMDKHDVPDDARLDLAATLRGNSSVPTPGTQATLNSY